MRHENRYQIICEMLQAYDNATGNRGADHVIKNPHAWTGNAWQPFYANAAELLIEAREAMDTKTGSDKTIFAAVKRVYKSIPEYNYSLNGIIEAADKNGVTKYILCDGHRILRLNSDVSSLPHVEKEKALSAENINRLMDGANNYGDKLNLPTVAEIKSFMAEEKAKGRGTKNNPYKPICIGGFTWVNPQYLLDFVQALPDCIAYKPENEKSPIYFSAENGDGILLPVRHIEAAENAA